MRQESIILTKEIISHIMGNIGFVPNSKFGTAGASQQEYILDKKIIISNISDDDTEKKQYCKIWGAVAKSNDSKFRVLFSDLTSEDGVIDYLLVLRVNNGPIHGMNLCYYSDEISNYFIIFDDKYKKFNSSLLREDKEGRKLPDMTEASTYDKCMSLAGIELITQLGVDWKPIDDYDDLYEAIKKLAEV